MSGDKAALGLLLVESHPLMREGLRALIARIEGVGVAGEASMGEEALAACTRSGLDMALIGETLGGLDLFATVEGMSARAPQLRLLVCHERLAAREAAKLMRLGVRGLVSRTAMPCEIIAALRGIAEGGAYALERRAPAEPAGALSAREAAVLRLLGQGFSNKDIADRLGLSVRTVETHRFNLRRKSGASRRHELQQLAHRLGLLGQPDAEEGLRRVRGL